MSEASIKVTGTVNRESYLSISRFMLAPRYKILFALVIAAGAAGFIALTVRMRDLTWLLWAALWIAIGCFVYRWVKKNIINRVMAHLHDLKKGCGYDLEIRFDDDAIRVHNRVTSRDTALSYDMFGSYVETEQCIALFVRTGEYLLIPRTNLSEAEQEKVVAWVQKKCRGMHKRLL